MSSHDHIKELTEKLIENAVNDERVDDEPAQSQVESEKMILEEISSEKVHSEDISEPEHSGDTESSRDLKSEQKELIVESEQPKEETEESEQPKEQTEELKEPKEDTDKLKEPKEDTEELKEPNEEWQDVLGSGVIMKKILKEGQANTRPSRSEKCFINYTCRLEDADEDTFVEKQENFQLALSENDVVQGLDVALGLMNKGERCLLKIGPRLAYGDKGYPPQVPENATVIFDVELLDVQEEDEIELLTIPERRKMGSKKRERGNWWYQRGENTIAIQCYRRALNYLDEVEHSEEKPTDSDLQQLLEDRLKVLNNMASAQIKMELYDQALTSLETVLRCQPNNIKALFRKAKIFSYRNELGMALKLLEKARTIEPDDPLIGKELNVIINQITKQKNSEREYARRMFRANNIQETSSKSSLNLKKSRSGKSEENKSHVWLVTLGIGILVGVASFLTYKAKFP